MPCTFSLQIDALRDFVSEEVASLETPDVDLERFKRQVETYLQELKEAIKADLDAICDNCCPGSSP